VHDEAPSFPREWEFILLCAKMMSAFAGMTIEFLQVRRSGGPIPSLDADGGSQCEQVVGRVRPRSREIDSPRKVVKCERSTHAGVLCFSRHFRRYRRHFAAVEA
jgi:hypothetical protein